VPQLAPGLNKAVTSVTRLQWLRPSLLASAHWWGLVLGQHWLTGIQPSIEPDELIRALHHPRPTPGTSTESSACSSARGTSNSAIASDRPRIDDVCRHAGRQS
jgi:hypothetical protein